LLLIGLDTWVVLGVVAGLVALAFLYARAKVAASHADTLKAANDRLKELLAAERSIIADKEQYIRDLEKTILGSLPAGKLAERLTRLFAAGGRGAPSAVLPGEPPAGPPKP
jgi:hypothetical protein